MIPQQRLREHACLKDDEGEQDGDLGDRSQLSSAHAGLRTDAIGWNLQAVLASGHHP